jgi:hypothetical protein
MQRVFRFSLIGILGIAGLTACGDKVNVQGVNNSADSTVIGVTVTPTSATMNVGDKLTFFASVSTGSAIKDHTVTWSSSNAAVATVDATGIVTAKAAGTTSIIATANADKTQGASATVTVGAGAQPTLTISSINQNNGLNSLPANLANVVGQLDVILNVDPGTQKLNEVDLIMNCTGPGNTGTDTIVQKQVLSSSNLAPDASEASAPVTISFNTATFNPTSGAVSFKNGNCVIKAQAITASASGTLSTTKSTDFVAVLNNPDVIIGTMTAGKTALNPVTGLAWNGQSVTIAATPVFFTPNRSAVSQTITYEGKSATLTGAGTQTVTFIDENDPAKLADALNIDNITQSNSQATLTVVAVDNNGQNFANNAVPIATAASFFANPLNPLPPWINQNGQTNDFRLDTKKPASGSLVLASNQQQGTGPNSFLNAAFRFAGDSAAGYFGADVLGTSGCVATSRVSNCDNGGVDSVTVVFQTSTSSTGTFTTVTTPSSLAETATGTTDFLRQITTDRLGNADTTWVCGNAGPCLQWSANSAPTIAKFGVDKTAPTLAFNSGTADKNTFQVLNPGPFNLDIQDPIVIGGAGVGTFAGAGTILVAQVRQWNGVSTSTNLSGFENHVDSDIAAAARLGETFFAIGTDGTNPCVIGRFNAASANAGANALPVVERGGATVGFCTPVPYQPAAGPGTSDAVQSTSTGALNGYFTTRVVPTDQAGNIGSIFNASILADANAPNIVNTDIPPTIAGGATVPFPAAATDTLPSNSGSVGDIVNSWVSVVYPAATLQYAVTPGPGVAFDNVLTRTATITPTVPNFIKNLQVGVAGTPATTTANATNSTGIIVSAQDAANNVGSLPVSFATQPSNFTGSSTNFGTNGFTGGFSQSVSAATVSNGPASVTTPANPLSTVITAVATGVTNTFINPFTAVQLWYRPSGGTVWFQAPASDAVQGAIGGTDNGVTRSFVYTFTWNPPAATPASSAGAPVTLTPPNAGTINVDVMVIGINANGDAIGTTFSTITLTNP